LTADLESEAETSSSRALLGHGSATAVNALIATNLVQSAADAHVTGSSIASTGGGDVAVDAQNSATLDASALNATTSGGAGVGVTLAFNSIGWKPQNVLFNAVDAIIGDPAVSTAFGGEVPSGATAYLHDSEVGAEGAVGVSATAGEHITSSVQNQV